MAMIAVAALVLASDPRAAIEAAHAGHQATSDTPSACCAVRTSCCGMELAEAETPAPIANATAPTCPCCLPNPTAPPVETDGRGVATSSTEVVAPASIPAVTLADLPRPTSSPFPSALGPAANDPPIFLRTCRLLF